MHMRRLVPNPTHHHHVSCANAQRLRSGSYLWWSASVRSCAVSRVDVARDVS